MLHKEDVAMRLWSKKCTILLSIVSFRWWGSKRYFYHL